MKNQVNRSTGSSPPGSLLKGELAWADGTSTLYIGNAATGAVTSVGGSGYISTLTGFNRLNKSANYTILPADGKLVYVRADTSGGTFTITLPAASGGATVLVAVADSGLSSSVSVAAQGGDILSDGVTSGTYTLNGYGAVFLVQADGAIDWHIIMQVLTPGPQAFNTAGTGLSSSGTTVSLTSPVTVAHGGTNATSASAARTSLGCAASGNNSDITKITGLTTALAVNQGGTASTTASAARTALSAAVSGNNADITKITGLTTALAVNQGGTSFLSGYTKGDLLVATGATALTRLNAAADGKFLKTDSSQTSGLIWDVPTITIPGSDTQVFFNQGGTFAAASKLFWEESISCLGIGADPGNGNRLEIYGAGSHAGAAMYNTNTSGATYAEVNFSANNGGFTGQFYVDGNNTDVRTNPSMVLVTHTASTDIVLSAHNGDGLLVVSATGNVVSGGTTGSALATSATAGFFWITNCSGTPTGTPSPLYTGRTALQYDTSAHKLWAYDSVTSTWRGVALT